MSGEWSTFIQPARDVLHEVGDMRAQQCVACDVRPPLQPPCLWPAPALLLALGPLFHPCDDGCNYDGTRWVDCGTVEVTDMSPLDLGWSAHDGDRVAVFIPSDPPQEQQ